MLIVFWFNKASFENRFRLFSLMWGTGFKVHKDYTYQTKLTFSLKPRLLHLYKSYREFRATVLGLNIHYRDD